MRNPFKILSVRMSAFLIFFALFLFILGSGAVIFTAIHESKEDSDIINALGRQRMLAQAMGKNVFAYAVAKSRRHLIERQAKRLDDYVSRMRKVYTEIVVEPAEAAGIKVSATPAKEKHFSVPLPITFSRLTNEALPESGDFQIEVLSDSPINSRQGLKSELDREANEFIKTNPGGMFSKIFEQGGALWISLYTAEKATTASCVSCHIAYKGVSLKVGDILGIRKFSLMYSSDVAAGRRELGAGLEDFEKNKRRFGGILSAVRKGGDISPDREPVAEKIIQPVLDENFQKQVDLVEEKFRSFVNTIEVLLTLHEDSSAYQNARQEVVNISEELTQESGHLTDIYVAISERNLRQIQITVTLGVLLTLFTLICVYLLLSRKVLTPVATASHALSVLAAGNLSSGRLPVGWGWEIRELQSSLNMLIDTLGVFIGSVEGILRGRLNGERTLLRNDFESALQRIIASVREKESAQTELSRAHKSLEAKVQERTAELLETNSVLVKEVARREQSEENLRETNLFLKSILESPHDISIVSTDLNKNILYWNRGAENLLGYSAEEMVGRQTIDVVYAEGDNQEVVKKALAVIQQSKRGITGEVLEKTRDGRRIWVKLTISPRLNERGEVIGLLGIGENVSRRKQAEEDLRRSEERFRLILDTAYHAFVSMDSHGVVMEWNRRAEQLFGWARDEVMGQRLSTLVFPDNAASLDAALRDYVEKGGDDLINRSVELKLKNKKNEGIPVEMTVTPLAHHGRIFFNVFIDDISEKKRMQVQLVHAQKMESIGQLSAGIAHEINTPLQYIGDNVRFLQNSFAGLLDLLKGYETVLKEYEGGGDVGEHLAKLRRMAGENDLEFLLQESPQAIEQALDGVGRVSKIVQAMKEFSHPGVSSMKPTDLNRAIQTTLDISRNMWKYVAEVVTRLDPKLPLVPCYGDEFNQAVLNLVVNAAQAIGEIVGKNEAAKGTITITTRVDGDWAEILVEDTGPGIPEEIQPRIFDPFFTTKPVGVGTGQGLSIVHSVIVKKHGGSISFQSQKNRGTIFIVRLPIHPKADERTEENPVRG